MPPYGRPNYNPEPIEDQRNRQARKHPINRKINEYKGTFEHFLRDFAPSQQKYKRGPNTQDVFDKLLSDKTLRLEKRMYTPLVCVPLFF